MSQELTNAVVEMREDDALRLTDELLDGGTAPMEILDACRGALDVIGERFEKGEAFLPELMLAGEMMTAILKVADLGVDVPPPKFVEAVKVTGAKIVGLSGFLTLSLDPMKDTVAALRAAGLTDVKVMIGGGQIDEHIRDCAGADAYGRDAMAAAALAKGRA